MARISTYQEDASITGDDILLGSSAEGSFNGNTTYVTRNFRLSELAEFFNVYNPDSGSGGSGDLTALTNRVIALENAGYLTEHPNISASTSVDNSGQFFIQDITLDSNGHIIGITSAEASGGGGGGITTETDPVYSASPAAGISASNITNWNTAYGWGDHSAQGYLTTESDPTVPSHVKEITVTEVANWNTAYGWGDHSTQGYLTTFSESDPTVPTHVKNIAQSDITEWNSAYDNSIVSMSVTGTSTKTITLTQQDGGTVTASFTDISETGSGGITDTNDFVTSATLTSGTLTLGIPNQTNVTVSGFSQLTSFSATNNSTATGDGSLAYNSNTGEFIYTPADFSGDFLSLSGGTITGDLTVNGIINVNSANGTSNFINDVSIDGDLSVDGALTVGTITADVRGDVYSIVGATASTKVLESGSGSTPTAYFIGDLTTGAGDANMVFDTSLSMFRNHDVKIGDYNNALGGGAENLDLYLGATSSIFFGAGTNQKEISATFISDLNFTIFSTITGTSFTNGVLTLRTKGADQNEPGYSNYTENLQTYFDGRYVELAGDTMTGNLSFSTESIGVVGNIFNTNGTKILENGSNTQTAYLVGNVAGDIIESDLTTVIFDSSEDAFTRDINIGVPGTNGIISDNFDIDLGVTSEIYFGRGITQQQQYVSASKISIWDSNVITSTYYDLVGTNNDEIQIRIVKDNDPNSYITTSNNITGGTYINITSSENPGTETDGHDSNDPIILDVNTTALDLLYVNIDGDTMTGMLQFSGANGVAGDIYADNLTTRLLNNGTSSGGTYNNDAWFQGNLRAGDLQDINGNTIFDSSEATFETDVSIGVDVNNINNLNMHGASKIWFDEGITDQEAYIDKTKINTWDSQEEVSNMYFYEEGTTDTFRLRLRKQTDSFSRNTSVLIEKGAYMTMSVTDDASDSYTFGSNTIGALNIGLNYSGLETQLDSVYARLGASVSGVTVNSGGAITGTLNIEDGTSISAVRDGATNNVSFNFIKGTGATGYLQQQDGDARYIQIGGETQNLDDVITNGATTTTTAVIPFYYANQSGFPSATTYHGAIAHSHNDGAMYFAHSGVWNKMANSSDLNNYALSSALPTAQEEQNWNDAYNNSITDITLNTVTGGADEGKIVLTQQDSGVLKTTSLDLRYAKLGTHPAVATSAANTSNAGNDFIQNLTFDSFGHVLSVSSGTVNALQLASGDNPANGEVATFDSSGDIVSSSITGILPSTTVFTTSSPNFGSNTITAGDFILSSDRDLKENIIPLAEREINVDFKEYNFKGSNRTRFGVIAQELEENHPEFVHTRESGDKSVSYIDLLVAKVHELENRIKQLEDGSRDR